MKIGKIKQVDIVPVEIPPLSNANPQHESDTNSMSISITAQIPKIKKYELCFQNKLFANWIVIAALTPIDKNKKSKFLLIILFDVDSSCV